MCSIWRLVNLLKITYRDEPFMNWNSILTKTKQKQSLKDFLLAFSGAYKFILLSSSLDGVSTVVMENYTNSADEDKMQPTALKKSIK